MMSWLPRTRQTILLVFIGVLVQYVFVYFLWTSFCQSPAGSTAKSVSLPESAGKITCIIRDFEVEANDLAATVRSLSSLEEVDKILVVSDRKLYPPLSTEHSKLSYFEILPSIRADPRQLDLRDLVTTQWVLVVPDGTIITASATHLHDYLALTSDSQDAVKVWAFRVRGKRASCQTVFLDWKRWTLTANSSANDVCDAVTGSVVHLLRNQDFFLLLEPLMQPMDESLLVQSFTLGWKTAVFENTPFSRSGRSLDPQILSEQRNNREEKMKSLYERFQVKKSIKNGNVEMFGCSKTTRRCFGSVVNETPSYLVEGRWTPPCCINALKATLQHVVEVLEFNNVAYWLEGGSLLGAARNGELIPWDYDVDVGIFFNESGKIQYLQAASEGPVLDPEGFVWEKSQPSEGEFYRVFYSRTNRMHVDIFPFYAKNSLMTKDFWFSSHPQDREFPEHFLTPMESLTFLGLTVSAPNHIREFLELKFGPGCIEQPQYPHNFTFDDSEQ